MQVGRAKGAKRRAGADERGSRRDSTRSAEPEKPDDRRRGSLGLPLQVDENVLLVGRPSLAVTWPKTLCTLGLYELWRKRRTTVVTDHRLLLNKGVFARSERAIPFARIEDASFTRRGLSAYTELLLRGGKNERVGPLRPSIARRITAEVLTHT